MTVAAITTEIQKLEPSAVVELFEMDATDFGGDLLRFHAGTNGLSANVVWQGNTYTAYPIKATGFDFTGNGQLPRPKLTVSNVTGAITLLVLTYDDLLGAKITRKRTMVKYLDAVNFPGSTNPDADDTAEFPDDVFFIDRKATETRDMVEFELAASFDVAGVLLPHRQIIQNVCVWRYKGTECGYTPDGIYRQYFDANDLVVGSSGLDKCGKRLTSCKIRFGQNEPLPFGSFPSAGLVR